MMIGGFHCLTRNDLRPEDLHMIANSCGFYVRFDAKLKKEFLIWKNHYPEYKNIMDSANAYVINTLIDKRFDK
jgi:hypothetical protein